jgi:hypothetical protein
VLRIPILIVSLVALAAIGPLTAPAAAKQSITASPNPVDFGETLVVKGKGWPVIEICSRTVRLSLRSAQNAFPIGKVKVRANGRFRFEWVPRRAKVGAGRWRLVARRRCQSLIDGSPVFTRASTPVRIR